MKKLILLFIPILILNNLYSQKVEIKNDSAEYKLDFTNPISVVNGLIFAAKTKNIELASLVFDPFAQSGQMTKNKTLYLTMDKKRIDQLYEIRGEDEAGGFSQNLEIVPETEREIIARLVSRLLKNLL